MTWFDWEAVDTGLLDFTRRLIALRREHPVFRRGRFLAGAEAAELRWFTPAGTEMNGGDWSDPSALAIALYLDGADDPDRAANGTWLVDDDFLVLVNAWWEPLEFVLPETRPQARWRVEIDSWDPAAPVAGEREADDTITVGPRVGGRPDEPARRRRLSDLNHPAFGPDGIANHPARVISAS